MLRRIFRASHDRTIRAMNKTLEAIRARRARQAGVVEEKPKRAKAKPKPADEGVEEPTGPSPHDIDEDE
jgi:hypothetical protein